MYNRAKETKEILVQDIIDSAQSIIDNAENIVGNEKHISEIRITIALEPGYMPLISISKELIPERKVERTK